jgi:hypothetical protein
MYLVALLYTFYYFLGWLEESKVKTGAFYKICKSELRAQKSDLKKHANSALHRRNLQKYAYKSTLTDLGEIVCRHVSMRSVMCFFYCRCNVYSYSHNRCKGNGAKVNCLRCFPLKY